MTMIKEDDDQYDNDSLTNVDMSSYDDKKWFSEIQDYLINVMGMNADQVKVEFDKRFPELLERGLGL